MRSPGFSRPASDNGEFGVESSPGVRYVLFFLIHGIFAFWLSTVNAFSADWSFTPSVTLSPSYDSNFRFLPKPLPGTSKDDFITNLSTVASVTRETEETLLQFDTVTTGQAYVKNPRFDTVNTDTTATLNETLSPRFSINENFGLIHDSTLEDQLQQAGIVTVKAERYQFNFGLGGKYDLNESFNVSVSGSFNKTIYPSGLLLDSYLYEGSVTPEWAIDERDKIGLNTNFSFTGYTGFETIQTLTETVQWERLLTETTSFKLSGGYYFTRFDFSAREFVSPSTSLFVNGTEAASSGYVFAAEFKKDWTERFTTTFSTGRQQYNDANARSFNSTLISGTASYKLSELTTVNLNVRYNINDQISQGSQKIDYYMINPSIERNLTEKFLLRLSVSFENESEDFGVITEPNQNFNRFRTWIDLTYKWPKFISNEP